jgi:hypothetical protein
MIGRGLDGLLRDLQQEGLRGQSPRANRCGQYAT